MHGCRCASIAKAAGVSVLKLLVTVLLTMYTTFTAFTEDYVEGRTVGASDVLQVISKHA